MELLSLFLGFALVLTIINIYVLNKNVNVLKKLTKQRNTDASYFKNAYIKYYDKYKKLTQPERAY